MKAVLWPLFSCLAWAQPALELASTTGDCAALASDTMISVGSDSHRVG